MLQQARGKSGTVPHTLADTPGGLRGAWQDIATPAFVYDEAKLLSLLDTADRIREAAGCQVLYAMKALAFVDVLETMAGRLDGFAASSVFEARLASHASGGHAPIHITTPGMRPADVDEIAALCDYISFNSLSQWEMFRETVGNRASIGLRVNPQLSFAQDERYDPCRLHSKLGVPLDDLAVVVKQEPRRLSGLEGILIHSNCESTDYNELLATVRHLQASIPGLLEQVKWINLGGGYLFDEAENVEQLAEAVGLLRDTYGVQVFIEPGTAFVRSVGSIVSTVVDVFQSGGESIAVLDTTVNHMPEVFEYEYEPDVLGHDDSAPHSYILAGATCLSGDIFGTYRFREPLQVGARIVIQNAGSYTLSKAHMFNGVNLPAVYALTDADALVLKKEYDYADFAGRWGANVSVS